MAGEAVSCRATAPHQQHQAGAVLSTQELWSSPTGSRTSAAVAALVDNW